MNELPVWLIWLLLLGVVAAFWFFIGALLWRYT